MGMIYVVRHGQDEDNARGVINGHRNTNLTALGRQQALEASQKLKEKNIHIAYTSPLARTYQTAHIISQELGLSEVYTHPHLIERKFGVMTGKPFVDMPKYADSILIKGDIMCGVDIPGAESLPEVYGRAFWVLKDIQEKHLHQNVLLVTHGETARSLYAAHHRLDWFEGAFQPYLHNCEILELELR